MNALEIINLILILGVIQGFAFNIFTVHITRRKVSMAVIYLNLTVLFISLNNLQAWYLENFQLNNFFFNELLIPFDLAILPVFHAFLVYYLRIEKSKKTYIKIASILFFFLILIRTSLIAYTYYFIEGRDDILIIKFTVLEEIFIAGFSLFIFYKCYQLIFLKGHFYSFILKFDDISWLRTIWKLGTILFFLWVVAISLFNISGNIIGYQILRLGLSGLIYWIGYQGFFRYHNIKDRIYIRESLLSNKALRINEKTKKQDVSNRNEFDSKHQKEFEKIDAYIIEKQRYLEPNLGLEELANELDISSTHLSKIINTYSDYNFPDYINSLRIQQAKKLLNDDSFCRYTIISIGLECGFNSKSTFYAAFKKFTSQTPSEYRDSTC